MRRGTTPAIVLTVDTDLTGFSVFVTIRSGYTENIPDILKCNSKNREEITIGNDRLTVEVEEGISTVAFSLTQEETLALVPGKAEIQVRAIHNGTAIATDIASVDVGRILLEGVIDE